MMTAGIVRVMLVADIVVMAIFALVYLRQRRMGWMGYLFWGLLAVGLPVIGPFVVIARRPGEWDPSYSLESDFARVVTWLRRMLPEPPPKSERIKQARLRRQHH